MTTHTQATDSARRGWVMFCSRTPRPSSPDEKAGWGLAAWMLGATGIRPTAPEQYLVLHSSDVEAGMVIMTPAALEGLGAPNRVTVDTWDWDGGETLLTWPGDSLFTESRDACDCADYNVADLGAAQMLALL